MHQQSGQNAKWDFCCSNAACQRIGKQEQNRASTHCHGQQLLMVMTGQQAGNVRNDQPTQPIMPAIATVLAVMSVAQTINPKRRRVTFSPSERASSSESVSKFMRQRRKNRARSL